MPETKVHKTCYMESKFMRTHGGKTFATKLVSHAWKSPFLNTVLNILVDAWECNTDKLEEFMDFDLHGTDFDATKMLKELEQPANKGVLNKAYWLCIFAVNEHLTICGDCWTCKPSTQAEFAALRCKCGKRKFNPCDCGSLKLKKGDEKFEVDKFDDVVKLMKGGLVVSLDPELQTLKRVWVVAEIGEAMKEKHVQFRCARGLASGPMENLRKKKPVLPPVKDCDYTSKDDCDMIGMPSGSSGIQPWLLDW